MPNAQMRTRSQQIAAESVPSEPDSRAAWAEGEARRSALADFSRLLVASWKLLAFGALLGLGIAAVYLVTSPRQYAAEALIAPSRSITQVQFEPKIQTVSDGSPQPGTPALTPERRQALVDLVRSSDIEFTVIQSLLGQVPADDLKPGELIQHIRGSLKPRSEILSIQAESAFPDSAVAITNAWASAYVDQVNRIYASATSGNSLLATRDKAQQDLQQAQDALTSSIGDSHLEQLDSDIRDREHRIALLQSAYQAGAFSQPDASAAKQQPPAQQPATSTSSNTRPQQTVDAATARGDYRLAEVRTLDDLAQTIRRLDATRENVRALLNQQGTSDSTSNGLALTLLKAQLVSISDGLPAQTQLQLPATGSGSADELQALAANIDQARAQVAAEFERRRVAYEQNRNAQIAALEQELRDLRSQRAQADAQRKQLTLQRDVASDTYTALAKKVEEQRIAQGTDGHEVELASRGSFAAPASKNAPIVLAAALVAGLLAAAALVLVRGRAQQDIGEQRVLRSYHAADRHPAQAVKS